MNRFNEWNHITINGIYNIIAPHLCVFLKWYLLYFYCWVKWPLSWCTQSALISFCYVCLNLFKPKYVGLHGSGSRIIDLELWRMFVLHMSKVEGIFTIKIHDSQDLTIFQSMLKMRSIISSRCSSVLIQLGKKGSPRESPPGESHCHNNKTMGHGPESSEARAWNKKSMKTLGIFWCDLLSVGLWAWTDFVPHVVYQKSSSLSDIFPHSLRWVESYFGNACFMRNLIFVWRWRYENYFFICSNPFSFE